MWKTITSVVIMGIGLLLAYEYLQDDKLDTLPGKRVLVTGASTGIGEQIAYHYARLGANVVVTARRLERLNKVVEECKSLSPSSDQTHFAISADMSKLEDTKRVIQQAVKAMSGLDILVLNHIKDNRKRIFTGSPEHLKEFETMMDINFRSYVHLTSHALPELLSNNGSIIVVNSIVGKMPLIFMETYSASKHALNGFFHSLKNQFVSVGQNVSVTSCTLGLIGTDNAKKQLEQMNDSLLNKFQTPASPSDTALAIIIGGARRVDDVFTPYMETRVSTLIYNIYPPIMDYIMRSIMALPPDA